MSRTVDVVLATEDVSLPHGYYPGEYPGGHKTMFTESEWADYGWNPHPGFPGEGVDPYASPKPTWAELVHGEIVAKIRQFRNEVTDPVYGLQGWVEALITKHVYGARSISHEEHIRSRLAGTELLARMNHTRDHYRQRYHEIKHWINSIPITDEGVRSVDAWKVSLPVYQRSATPQAFRDLFTGARWTPPGAAEPYAAHSGIPVYQHHDPGTPPFDLELTVGPAVANDAGDQVMALHIFATAKATFTLTYPTEAAIHADREATGSPLTEVDSAKPNGGTTTLWIKRRAGDTGDREMTAEISVFASPYGELKGAKTTVTFPAVPVAPPGG